MTLKYHCHDLEGRRRIEPSSLQQTDCSMDNPQASVDLHCTVEEASLRSRASSVVTTGTKFSISTLPNEELPSVLARSGRAAALRPRSMFSITSHESFLPPYDEGPQSVESAQSMIGQRSTEAPAETSESIEHTETSPTSPLIDSENTLSMHYGRVVRTIDQNHVNQVRRLKEAHQEELGAIRHAIDQAYRKELKAKSREVEKIREEMASLSAAHDAMIARLQREAIEQATEQAQAQQLALEKACNAIEDVWEARWNDRIRLADEEAAKRNTLHQFQLREAMSARDMAIADSHGAITNRDNAWIGLLSAMHPEFIEELEDIPGKLGYENSNC